MSALSHHQDLSFDALEAHRPILRNVLDTGEGPREAWQVTGEAGVPEEIWQGKPTRHQPTFTVERRGFGYVIHKVERLPLRGKVMQMVAGALGLVMWLFLANLLREGPATWRVPELAYPTALVVLAMALILLRYTTRGLLPYIEVDLLRGELREGVQHPLGRPTLKRTATFAALQALYMTAPDPAGLASVICEVATSDGPASWRVASGHVVKLAQLEALMRQHLHVVPGLSPMVATA